MNWIMGILQAIAAVFGFFKARQEQQRRDSDRATGQAIEAGQEAQEVAKRAAETKQIEDTVAGKSDAELRDDLWKRSGLRRLEPDGGSGD